jgi:hypothetical protein
VAHTTAPDEMHPLVPPVAMGRIFVAFGASRSPLHLPRMSSGRTGPGGDASMQLGRGVATEGMDATSHPNLHS